MEYKARLLTTRQKYAGVTEVLLGGIEDIIGKEKPKKGVYQLATVIRRLLAGEKVVAGSHKPLDLKEKGVYQLATVIRRLLAGEKVVAGSHKPFDLKDCQRIHPVLVTYEKGLGLEAVRQQAEAKFTATLQIDEQKRKQVGRLLILTIEEVELLETLALRHSLEEVIRDYADHLTANLLGQASSFRSFICNGQYNHNPPRSGETMVGDCFRRAMDWIGLDLERRHATAEARDAMNSDNPAA
jgi:hypothetical protein